MENKNNIALYSIAFLVVGMFVGSFITSNRQSGMHCQNMHKMPNGEMMQNGTMNDAMGSMMMGLKGKTGDDFDKAFLSEMIMHHEGAVVMAEEVLKTSKRPELLKLANDIISAQTKEVKMMQDWKKGWFNQ
ncbi:DUF305 domain-containing protein [Candidatus Woesebacteria bacterium]|nr:DUF305 domain-containing protein [Candidatus Woesebacteria bacterium]